MKIILAGPPRSGKSCLREGLKQAILSLVRELGIDIYPYVITGCPDGEGSWFQSTVNLSPEAAAQAKAEYKSKFTPAFVQRICMAVAACTEPLTLVDIGGIPSEENRAICADATHAVLLAGNWGEEPWNQRLEVWREFCADLNLVIVAEIFSDYYGTEDRVDSVGPDGILHGAVHRLERGEATSERPMVRALAEHLVHLATTGKPAQ